MKKRINNKGWRIGLTKYLIFMLGIILIAFTGCGGSSKKKPNTDGDLKFSDATFTNPTQVTNSFFPVTPGKTSVYLAEGEDGLETIVIEMLDETRTVAGVECVVVRDRAYLDELLVEDTYDWFAQDDEGNVWYMGEEVVNYEYDDDGIEIGQDNEGSWEAGKDIADVGSIAEAGVLVKANPIVGDSYHQEYYLGEAEDMALVEATNVTVTLIDGTVYEGCLKTKEWNPNEEDSEEYKYFAPGVGFIMEESVDGDEVADLKGIFSTGSEHLSDFDSAVFSNPTGIDNIYFPMTVGLTRSYIEETEDGIETIIIDVLDETRVVDGIMCRVVQDRVFLDEQLVEDTKDWYAQDDDGNVWYMGEEVVNYEYDDDGIEIGQNDEGSWEAGVDGAQGGIQMRNSPVAGESYYQEYLEGEADDMAMVVASGVTVVLSNGTIHENCLQTLDWVPLEPTALEYKFYAPEEGLVKEYHLGSDEFLEVVGKFNVGSDNLPDFNSAVFSNPLVIDNTYFTQTVGDTREYTADTEDGTETIIIDVLNETRLVDGILCRVVQDRVFLDGQLVEDTKDWFAQDDAGNVWYMGEEVVNYEYDDDGIEIGQDDEGSWEAGVDGAQGGIQMRNSPVAGESYYQEYLEGEADDMAMVVATGVSVTLSDGTTYENCLQTLDWVPLEPHALEYKFYAPGLGMVTEYHLGSDEAVELDN